MQDWRKYTLAFFITTAIFITAFYIAARIDSSRIADIRGAQEAIAIDLLSSEVQFELLGNLDCSIIAEHPVLTDELNSLAERLSFAEERLGSDTAEVVILKKQYTLLEIKDYLLMRQISQKCNTKPVSVLYFYSNTGDCPECSKTGDVLTYLRETYPDLRVYSFDYNLDLSALQTLITLRKIKTPLPALIINSRAPVYGFKTLEDMEKLMPELQTLATSTKESTSSATSTR
ncbi:MAG: Uncharacterized protein G01um101456_262 [Parcubacteria group bacterium Gr01-1014_56]|nr:MAG: Uncharacterized protein G01um101456_262 [Parcubacteria group bacterium Gr01-1014_56]